VSDTAGVGTTEKFAHEYHWNLVGITWNTAGSNLYHSTHNTLKSDTVVVLAVLPRYWGQNTRDSRGDGNQSCGTTAVMGLSFFLSRI